MYDILEIISQGSVDSMILNLTKYDSSKIPELEQYMEEAQFFVKPSEEDISETA